MHLFDFLSLSDYGSTMDLPWIKAFMNTRRTDADKIQADWSTKCRSHFPREDEIRRAALLAWEGHLTSVENMKIMNVSITDIPLDHMERLVSVVTGKVNINMIHHTGQLSNILTNVKCPDLCLSEMKLGQSETRALVAAMRDRVQRVRIGHVTMDIEELTQYDGQGRCSWFMMGGKTWRHWEKLRRWAADKGWWMGHDVNGGLEMGRMEAIKLKLA